MEEWIARENFEHMKSQIIWLTVQAFGWKEPRLAVTASFWTPASHHADFGRVLVAKAHLRSHVKVVLARHRRLHFWE